jgi:hypothetical protein
MADTYDVIVNPSFSAVIMLSSFLSIYYLPVKLMFLYFCSVFLYFANFISDVNYTFTLILMLFLLCFKVQNNISVRLSFLLLSYSYTCYSILNLVNNVVYLTGSACETCTLNIYLRRNVSGVNYVFSLLCMRVWSAGNFVHMQLCQRKIHSHIWNNCLYTSCQ